MGCRKRLVVRILGIALLLLALSPVTAPFSTCDLIDLFDGATAPTGPSIQSKASPHEPVSEAGRASSFVPVEQTTAALLIGATVYVDRPAPLDVPLRI